MDKDRKKQLKDDYKNKAVVGAVYAIECSESQSRLIKSTTDIGAIKNRFQFAQATKTCPEPDLRKEWNKYGTDAFSLVVLEELEMKEDQAADEFAKDIKTLHEMWREKLASDEAK